MSYEALPAHVDLAALDREVIGTWQAHSVFARSLQATAGRPEWTFYEGPPTANGMPGTHHIEARVFKDVFPRFKTMKGLHVPRMAGWDCHGLPVELAVEKELGFTGKPDIEAYGIAEFNARCRESVQRHVDAFAELTVRMGYWVDFDNAYWTMNPEYVESVWWALRQIFDKGLLIEDYRVTPYCPRCGTGLSDHEVAQGYEDVVDPSVYLRLPLTSGPYAGEASMLVWTTTPWTLPSNALVAVKADVVYVTATDGSETVIVARDLVERVLDGGWTVIDDFTGADMLGWTYQRPFDVVPWPGRGHFVVNEDYVTTDDGTGLVHQATVFGAVDLDSVRRNDVELVNPIDTRGRFDTDLPFVGGMFFKDADEVIIADLQARGLLFRHVPYQHAYPHCWRCHTPLMYYALPSWYIRTTEIKDALLRENEATNWYPETIKHGRYGDWLANNIDWALSRDRYWGTPLPIWRNDADPARLICVGSLHELRELSGVDLDDPHRPFVDDVTFTRPGEPGTYRRVPQVIDAWFDSGSMPFARFGAPHRSQAEFTSAYPADFICEAIDQTRGWFYTLMAVGTLVFDRSSYRNVVCLGHLLAEDGRKMSKHLGNILEPIPLMDRHGADAVRWFMVASGSPWSARRIGHKVLDEIASKVIRTYWSVASFQTLYARANNWEPTPSPAPTGSPGPASPAPSEAERSVTAPTGSPGPASPAPSEAERSVTAPTGSPGPASPASSEAGRSVSVLDRWALSEAHRLALDVDAALEDFDTQRAGRAIAAYIDDLSNWYVRRSRRRFWNGDPAALATLHECLHLLTLLMAPFTPFVTEKVWSALFAGQGGRPDSVHLAAWPTVDPASAAIDAELGEQVALVRRLVELGRSARADSKVKTRQPLARALISAPGWAQLPESLRREVADELNVAELSSLAGTGELVQFVVKPNFRVLGKRFGRRTQVVASAITAADPAVLVESLRAGRATVSVDGEDVDVDDDEVAVTETPRSGWAVASAATETVALDLELTHELRLAGLARDVVRAVQEARKNAGYEVTDRIELWWRVGGSPEPAEALRAHAAALADEVLAVSVHEGAAPSDEAGLDSVVDEEMGLHVWMRRIQTR
jgi:isoleucyl-tRNA synthetase